MEVDKKAKRILNSTYWEASGWKRENSVMPEDFAYAKAHGLMFDPVSMSHDQCVEDVRALSLGIGPQKAARAFLSSLSSRRLDWRSGFASYVMSTALEPHAFSSGVTGVSFSPEGQIIGSSVHCTQCGRFYGSPAAYVDEDLSVLNFEPVQMGRSAARQIAVCMAGSALPRQGRYSRTYDAGYGHLPQPACDDGCHSTRSVCGHPGAGNSQFDFLGQR